MTNIEQALARAQLYHWAARLFFSPDPPLLEALTSGAACEEISAAAAALPESEALSAALDGLQAACARLAGAELGLPEEHTHLFARAVRCPPYETSYDPERALSRPQDMAEIAGFYAAFGVRVSETNRETPDHISMELEFLSYLYAKQGYALEQAQRKNAKLCRKTGGRFVQEHLGRWLPEFAARLAEQARLPFYPAAAGLALALVNGEPQQRETSHAHSTHAPA
ncbi:MAG: molecular chaperone TorD family protein [Chloroflexi bacterium]|nr:molecular chaperone TorD family protein [Chloroflexota bacterium]